MVSKTTKIVNEQGFHLRPATLVAQAMGKYTCSVVFRFNGKDFNAKSPMFIMAACLKCGNEFEVVCDGPDENEALAEVVGMIESGLGD